jgi:hypothetical protein
MKKTFFVLISIAFLAAGCANPWVKAVPQKAVPQEAAQSKSILVGNDRDEHGCIGSAGYSWCEAKQKCLRLWEESCGEQATSTQNSLLSEAAARVIAEKSCIKGGEALTVGSYDKNSKTWWFDANLNATRKGCSPSCVVSEETKKAEITWRCSVLVPPK